MHLLGLQYTLRQMLTIGRYKISSVMMARFRLDGGAMFGARVHRCNPGGLDVQFETCPLKAAWCDAGLPDEEVAQLCDIAAQADYGTLETAGFAVAIETWRPGRSGCCVLRVRPRD